MDRTYDINTLDTILSVCNLDTEANGKPTIETFKVEKGQSKFPKFKGKVQFKTLKHILE